LTDFVYSAVLRALDRHGTRDPYRLLKGIGAVTVFSNEYAGNGLKGYSAIMNRCMYAVVNNKLRDAEMKVTAGHEAAHLILHKSVILSSPVKAMRDFNLFSNAGRYEREANLFIADFMLDDETVMETAAREDTDYFMAARELCVPPPLLAFKLYSMTRRGYDVLSPVDLDSGFLSKKGEQYD
jgi:Zn-dependent peptidase ImmA (M78 family)